MPKVKQSWECQSCHKHFTTKYSLMRHFKRFPPHSPANLSDGSHLKPVTITVNENEHVRTVQVVVGPVAATPHQQHGHGTRLKRQPRSSKAKQSDIYEFDDLSDPLTELTAETEDEEPGLPVVEKTPSPNNNETPMTELPSATSSSSDCTNDMNNDVKDGGKNKSSSNEQFPFLPRFLEEEQILSIATPQQAATLKAATTKLGDHSNAPTPLAAARYSRWMAGGDLLSPLAPACNSGKLESAMKTSAHGNKPRSPVEEAALDESLMVGSAEAQSPLTFLEKTPTAPASLNFLSSPSFFSPTNGDVSLEDMDFGFAF